MSGTVKALVSADQPLIRIYGGDGEYAEIQFETQDDANAAVCVNSAGWSSAPASFARMLAHPSCPPEKLGPPGSKWLGSRYRSDR